MRSLIGIPQRLFRLTERASVLVPLLLYGFSLAAFSRQTEFSWPVFGGCYLGALGSYVYWLRRLPAMTRGELLGLLGTGLGLRLLFLFQDPLLSADLYRCIWEGLVTVGGKNPYLLPPAHPALVELRPVWHHLINHPDYPAIYPPLTTLFNALVAVISPTPFFYKSCLGFCDLLLTLVIGLRLKTRASSRRYLLLYFLHPLAIIEIWGSGHHEALVMLAALIALHAQERRQPWLAVSGLVAAVFSKY
ncbi:MAG: hypothetical protein JXR89_12145, partial [Deltaproteobacteria bacterium]|nr:hypothetical protein [Deltaproteobacteria bacterium]